ncbi:hypothetical protein L1887_06022 [Cichorium endivia]|nr:hypothetical protein L1887_06022 [Cichorium endivia]
MKLQRKPLPLYTSTSLRCHPSFSVIAILLSLQRVAQISRNPHKKNDPLPSSEISSEPSQEKLKKKASCSDLARTLTRTT